MKTCTGNFSKNSTPTIWSSVGRKEAKRMSEKRTNERTETHACDLIERQAAIDAMNTWDKFGCDPDGRLVGFDDNKHYVPYVRYDDMVYVIKSLPSAQPEVIHCRECGHHHYEKDIPYCDRIDYGYGWKDNDFCSRAERREE
jgi:ribosomal protein L37E